MTVDVLGYGTTGYYDMMVRRGTVICGSESKYVIYVKQFKQFKQLEPLSRGNDDTPPSTRYCSAGFTSASSSIASGHGRGLRSIVSYFRSFGRHPERDIVAVATASLGQTSVGGASRFDQITRNRKACARPKIPRRSLMIDARLIVLSCERARLEFPRDPQYAVSTEMHSLAVVDVDTHFDWGPYNQAPMERHTF